MPLLYEEIAFKKSPMQGIGKQISKFQNMPTDLSMWDINPKTGPTPLTITWVGYLIIAGYTPIYPVLNGEYVQLQVDMGNGQWVDIPGAATQTSHNSSDGYEGYSTGTYTIPTTWPPGEYSFRLYYPGSTTKGLDATYSTTLVISIISGGGGPPAGGGGAMPTKIPMWEIAAAAGVAIIAVGGIAYAVTKGK